MTNIEIKTRSIMDSLNNSERKVAEYLVANIDTIFSTPLSKLAENTGVSQVTWVRFCKALGFNGLKDLKRELVNELNSPSSQTSINQDYSDIRNHSNIGQMASAIARTTTQAVNDTLSLVEDNNLNKVIKTLSKAKQIKLFGVGASGLVAADFSNKLLRINKSVIFSSDLHTQLTYSANSTADEVAVIFTYSGHTSEMIEVQELCRNNQCPTIAITKYSKSPIVENADYTIYLSAPEIDRRSGAMSSRIAQLTIVDLLFTGIANKTYDNVESSLKKSTEFRKKHRI